MKKVVITGAAAGIGRATVQACLANGCFVIAADYNEQGLRDLYELPGAHDRLETVAADLSSNEEIATFMPGLFERHAHLDALVNNAGVYHGRSVFDYTNEDIDHIWRLNVKALVCLSRDFALGRQGHDAGDLRSIVNIASVAGEVGSMDALYGATKAAVIGLTKANAWNFAPRVRVNAVSPALVRETAIFQRIPTHRRIEYERQEVLDQPIGPQGVADVILFLLSEQSRHLTGKVIPVDNGAYPR